MGYHFLPFETLGDMSILLLRCQVAARADTLLSRWRGYLIACPHAALRLGLSLTSSEHILDLWCEGCAMIVSMLVASQVYPGSPAMHRKQQSGRCC